MSKEKSSQVLNPGALLWKQLDLHLLDVLVFFQYILKHVCSHTQTCMWSYNLSEATNSSKVASEGPGIWVRLVFAVQIFLLGESELPEKVGLQMIALFID